MNWKTTKYKGNVDEDSGDNPFGGAVPLFLNLGNNNNEDGPPRMMGGCIRVVENHIYFYGDIDEENALDLNRILHEVDVKLQNTRNVLGDEYTPIIHLHLNTYGGGIFAAFSTVDVMRNLKSKIYTYIEGSVASAGTLLSCVGNKRFVGAYSHFLIHQLSKGIYGKFSEIEDEFYNATRLMKLLKDFYKKYTKIPMKKLDELMAKDIWLTPEEVIQFGMADEIR